MCFDRRAFIGSDRVVRARADIPGSGSVAAWGVGGQSGLTTRDSVAAVCSWGVPMLMHARCTVLYGP